MPRGFKKDILLTNKISFADKRSFVSIDGHLLLYGKDKEAMRHVIFCFRNPENLSWNEGEWHHLRNAHNQKRRCDCIKGGIFISKSQHRKQHVHTKFGVCKAKAVKDFNKLYPENQ